MVFVILVTKLACEIGVHVTTYDVGWTVRFIIRAEPTEDADCWYVL